MSARKELQQELNRMHDRRGSDSRIGSTSSYSNNNPISFSLSQSHSNVAQDGMLKFHGHPNFSTTENYSALLSEKVRQQALKLQEMENYILLCEKKLFELDPNFELPLSNATSCKLNNIDSPNIEEKNEEINKLKRIIEIKSQDLQFAQQKIEKLINESKVNPQPQDNDDINKLKEEILNLSQSLKAESLANEVYKNYIEATNEELRKKSKELGLPELVEITKLLIDPLTINSEQQNVVSSHHKDETTIIDLENQLIDLKQSNSQLKYNLNEYEIEIERVQNLFQIKDEECKKLEEEKNNLLDYIESKINKNDNENENQNQNENQNDENQNFPEKEVLHNAIKDLEYSNEQLQKENLILQENIKELTKYKEQNGNNSMVKNDLKEDNLLREISIKMKNSLIEKENEIKLLKKNEEEITSNAQSKEKENQDLRDEIDKLKKYKDENKELSKKLKDLREQYENEMIDNSKQYLEDKENIIQKMITENNEVQTKNIQTINDLNLLVKNLQKTNSTLSHTLSESQNEYTKSTSDIERLKDQIELMEKIGKENIEKNEKLEKLEKLISELKNKEMQAKMEFKSQLEKLELAEKLNRDFERQISELNSKVISFEYEKKMLNDQTKEKLFEKSAEIKTLFSDITSARIESKDIKEELMQTKEFLSKAEAESEEIKKINSEKDAKIEALTKDYNEKIEVLKKRLSFLENQDAEYDKQVNQNKQNEIVIIKLKSEINEFHARSALNNQKIDELTLERNTSLDDYSKLLDQFKILEIEYNNKKVELEKWKIAQMEIENKRKVVLNEKNDLEQNLSSEIQIKEKILLELSEMNAKNNLIEKKYSELEENFEIIKSKYENCNSSIQSTLTILNKFSDTFNNETKSDFEIPFSVLKQLREISKKINCDCDKDNPNCNFNFNDKINRMFNALIEQINYLCKYVDALENENKLYNSKMNDLEINYYEINKEKDNLIERESVYIKENENLHKEKKELLKLIEESKIRETKIKNEGNELIKEKESIESEIDKLNRELKILSTNLEKVTNELKERTMELQHSEMKNKQNEEKALYYVNMKKEYEELIKEIMNALPAIDMKKTVLDICNIFNEIQNVKFSNIKIKKKLTRGKVSPEEFSKDNKIVVENENNISQLQLHLRTLYDELKKMEKRELRRIENAVQIERRQSNLILKLDEAEKDLELYRVNNEELQKALGIILEEKRKINNEIVEVRKRFYDSNKSVESIKKEENEMLKSNTYILNQNVENSFLKLYDKKQLLLDEVKKPGQMHSLTTYIESKPIKKSSAEKIIKYI